MLCCRIHVLTSKVGLFSWHVLLLSGHALHVGGTYMVVALRRLHVDDALLHERLLLLQSTLVEALLLRKELVKLRVTLCLAKL